MGCPVITFSLVNSSSLRTIRLNVREPCFGPPGTSGGFPITRRFPYFFHRGPPPLDEGSSSHFFRMKHTTQGPRPPRRLTLLLSSALLVLCLTGLLWRLPAPRRATDDEALSGARASAAPAPDPSTLENVETQITRLTDAYGKLPLGFETNEGQADPEVKFLSRGSGYTIFLTPTGATLRLRNADCGLRNGRTAAPCAEDDIQKDRSQNPQSAFRNPQTAVLRMSLVGANERAAVAGLDEQAGRSNYLIGNDPSRWRMNVANYSRVRYAQVYPGVNLEYYGNQKQLEYDFRLAPGTSAERVRLAFKGADSVRVDEASGDLLVETAGGELRQRRPVVYH